MEDTITQEERGAAYNALSPEKQALYASAEAGKALGECFARYRLESSLYPIFALAVGDVILGIYPKDMLPELLAYELDIPIETAQSMEKHLNETFFNMKIVSVKPDITEGEETEKETFPAIQRVPIEDNEPPTPLTREDVLKALNSSRTMSSDVTSLQKKDTQ